MFRWLRNRKEKIEKRRQDKHRRMLNALKSKDTSGESGDYGFYKDEVMFSRVPENKQNNYEEIDDACVLPPQFTRIVGSNLTFDTTPNIAEKPPQLPARIFAGNRRSLSHSTCREISKHEKLRVKTISLPSFEWNPFITDMEEELLYSKPWDCKSKLTVQIDSDNINLGFYQHDRRKIATEAEEFDSKWKRVSLESKIHSEFEDSDTGCESDTISQTGSDYSVFRETSRDVTNPQGHSDDASDSDASSGFCESLSEINDGHTIWILKSLGNPEKVISSSSLFRFNTYPRSPCSKIDEDSELYLIPKRRCSIQENQIRKMLAV